MTFGEILVKFGAEISPFSEGITSMIRGLTAFGGAALTVGAIVAAALGAAALAVGAISVKMAGDFQQGMTLLGTSAGELPKNMAMVASGIKSIAVETGTSTGQLLAAMYLVESASFHGAAGLLVLRAAAMGAKTENASLAVVADAVTSSLRAYSLGADQSNMVMNTLIGITSTGKMKLQDLAAALGTVLPVAATAHVSLAEVGAALATMTVQGTHADQAATYLRQLLVALEAPSNKAAKALESIGLSSGKVSMDLRKTPDGLINTLSEITTALDKKFPGSAAIANAEFKKVAAGTETMDTALAHLSTNTSPAYVGALRDIAGGSRQMMAMFELTGAHIKDLRSNFEQILGTIHANTGGIAGWAAVQGNFNTQVDRAKAAIEVLAINIGTKLLPVLTQIAAALVPVIVDFGNFLTSGAGLSAVLAGVGTAGSTVVSAFNAIKGGLAGLGVVIATAVGAWGLLTVATNLYMLAASGQSVLGLITSSLAAMAVEGWAAAGAFLAGIIPALVSTAVAAWATAAAVIAATWPFLLIAAAVALAVVGLIALYQNSAPVRAVVAAIGTALQQVGAIIMGALAPALPILQNAFARLWASLQQLGAALKPLLPVLMLLGAILGGVIVVALGVLIGLLAGLAVGLGYLVTGIVMIFTGVVQVITGVIQVIVGIFTMLGGVIMGIFTGNWSMFSAGWQGFLQGLISIVSGAWSIIEGVFTAVFGTIIGFVGTFIATVINFFTTLFHALVGGSIIPDMLNAMLSAFTSFFSNILSAVASWVAGVIVWFINLATQAGSQALQLVTNVSNIFQTLVGLAASAFNAVISTIMGILHGAVGAALSAGTAIVQGIANGITAGIGLVAGAIGNVVSFIAAHLPHSPAKIGPLSQLDKFGPALTVGFAAGIVRGTPEVIGAVDAMVKPVGSLLAGTSRSGGGGGSRGTSGPVTIIIQVNGREFARGILPDLAQETILQMGGAH